MMQSTRWAACAVVVAACAAEPDLATETSEIDVTQYPLPELSTAERAAIVHGYEHVDPTNVVPRGLLEDALVFYDVHQARIANSAYLTVVDLSLFSGKDRFWLVDLTSGAVEPHKVSHGSGSDPEHDGYANTFSNVSGSNQSSLGFSLTAEIYDGTHQHSMRLDGLSPDGSPNHMANTRMRDRLVVVHEATYVDDSNTAKQGRSNGCPALDPSIEVAVVDKIHGGSLFYIANGTPLVEPVGRVTCGDALCDGDETAATCPADCGGPADDPDDPGDPVIDEPAAGGCSTGNGAGLALSLGVLGVMLRRCRSRRSSRKS